MKINIEYCVIWDYEPRARSLREDLISTFKDEFNILDIKLIEGGRGVFEVSVNKGLKVFSKKKTGRFPISSHGTPGRLSSFHSPANYYLN